MERGNSLTTLTTLTGLGRVLINRDWSTTRLVDVRFTPESGHLRCN
jgi:hypothetical protein